MGASNGARHTPLGRADPLSFTSNYNHHLALEVAIVTAPIISFATKGDREGVEFQFWGYSLGVRCVSTIVRERDVD